MKKIQVKVSKTKKGHTRIIDVETNRKLNKCSMSFYFEAYSYYAICWDSANYEKMCEKFLQLKNVEII